MHGARKAWRSGTKAALVVLALTALNCRSAANSRTSAAAPRPIAPAMYPALTDSIPLLESADPAVRQDAALAIARLGKDGAPAVPALIRRLDVEPSVVFAHALVEIGDRRAIGSLVRHIEYVYYPDRLGLHFGLEALPALEQVLREPDDESFRRHEHAARAIAQIGNKPASTLDHLRAALHDDLPPIPTGVRAPVIESCLRGCMVNPDDERSLALVGAIDSFGAGSEAAIPELLEAYRRRGLQTSDAAREILVRFHHPAVLSQYARWLDDSYDKCRDEAVRAFSGYGVQAKPAVPDLVSLLSTGVWSSRPDVARVLGEIGDPAAIEPLARSLAIENFRLRVEALRSLAHFGPQAAGFAPEIEALTGNWAPAVRQAAIEALRAVAGRDAPDHAPPEPKQSVQTDKGWEVITARKTIHLVSMAEVPPPPAACVEATRRLRSLDAVEVSGRCLLASVSSWDGHQSASVIDVDGKGGTERWTRFTNPREGPVFEFDVRAMRFVRTRDRLFVLAAAERAWNLAGRVTLLYRDAHGSWGAETVAELPGDPLAWGTDNGDLVVLTQQGRDADGGLYALRWKAAGQLEAMH